MVLFLGTYCYVYCVAECKVLETQSSYCANADLFFIKGQDLTQQAIRYLARQMISLYLKMFLETSHVQS